MKVKEQKYFIVTSHGWSASNWLAYALNLHPQIICTHSARNIQASDRNMNSDRKLRKHLQHLHKGYKSRQSRSIDQCYDEIEKLGQAEFYGSVHVYRLRDIPVIYKKFGSLRRQFNVVNLIRHPVSLVWSGYGQFKELFRYDLNELHWTSGKVLKYGADFILGLAEKYNLFVGDLENLAFIGAAAVLSSLRLDLDALEKVKKNPNICFLDHIKMEDITKSKEILRNAISILTDDQALINNSYLSNVYATGIVNQHKDDPNKQDAKNRYDNFTEWQKETLNFFMEKFDIRNDYIQLGYDFSFIENRGKDK